MRDTICQGCGHRGYMHFYNNQGELAECHASGCHCIEFSKTNLPEKSLVDDLAWVLASVVVGWEPLIGHDLAKHPEVVRVMARYRENKA